jgi:hypothetical protein
MAGELEVIDKRHTALEPVQSVVVNPMQELQMQIVRTGDLEKLKELRAIEKEWRADQAKEAFVRAMADFKSEAVRIVKGTIVKDGPLKDKKYANLFDVVNAITPPLSKHGLSHSWKLTKDEPAWMEITCTLTHSLGHSESVSMGAAPDTGPGRNAIQARGSAISYLQRYTLLAATGMAAGDTDTDGNPPPEEFMEEGKAADFQSSIEGSANMEELKSNTRKALIGCGVPERVLNENGDVIGSAKFKREARAFLDARQKMVGKLRGAK